MINTELIEKKVYVHPGYIYIIFEPTILYTVIGSGIVITIFDKEKRYGGINYYIQPIGRSPNESNAYYAFPGVVHLINMFVHHGSKNSDLEAHLYGGAENTQARGYISGLAEKNVSIAIKILELKKVHLAGQDTGAEKGRKIAFNTSTGEIMMAKVERIRNEDWYPQI